jgi:hypothetical protein
MRTIETALLAAMLFLYDPDAGEAERRHLL